MWEVTRRRIGHDIESSQWQFHLLPHWQNAVSYSIKKLPSHHSCERGPKINHFRQVERMEY